MILISTNQTAVIWNLNWFLSNENVRKNLALFILAVYYKNNLYSPSDGKLSSRMLCIQSQRLNFNVILKSSQPSTRSGTLGFKAYYARVIEVLAKGIFESWGMHSNIITLKKLNVNVLKVRYLDLRYWLCSFLLDSIL